MTKFFFRGGRLAWPPVLALLFSTFILVATDYAWRMVQGSLTAIVLCGVLFLIAGNIAIFVFRKGPR